MAHKQQEDLYKNGAYKVKIKDKLYMHNNFSDRERTHI